MNTKEKDIAMHISEKDKNRIEDCLVSGEKFILLTDSDGITHVWNTDSLSALMFMPEKESEEENNEKERT